MISKARSQTAPPTEYQIKAAFLFNFAKFVEWPPSAFPQAASPIVIGVMGDDSFAAQLVKTIRDKTLNNRSLVVKELGSPAEAKDCQLLFIDISEKRQLSQILKTLGKASVLTIGEMDRFTEDGGMINFVREGTKMRFQINEAAAEAVGLKVSSKLSSLALRNSH